jgi:acyl-CoA synthetase (AMP-forming)/AMP-acid ligase II
MVIVHTSGSTSAPKGVIHDHGPLVRHLENLNALRQLTPGVKLFSNSPMFWIGGLAYNVLGTLVAGATLICPTSADAPVALDFIERERPELVNGFAQSIANLMADPTFASRDFSSIRSGNLYAIMPERIRPRDPELRHNMLGTTETGSVCLMDPDESDQPEHRRGSFGRPVPDLEARVVDPDTFAEQPNGEPGELWLRGPLLMEGYDGRERWTTFTPDEWYRTGDAFRRDDDGLFYFLGRRDDMIKTGGANVSPREVEAVLRDVTGGLLPLVFGLPDPARGAIVAAVVVADADVPLDTDALRDALRERLSAYKVPRKIVRLAPTELPMLSSGKPDMRRLVEVVGGS